MSLLSFFDNIKYSDGISAYKNKLSEFASSPTKINGINLKSTQEKYELPASICNELIEVEINRMFKDILCKEKINRTDIDYINNIISLLNFELNSEQKLEIRRKYSIWQLEDNNKLPVYKSSVVDLPLKKGEIVHFYEPAILKKYKTKTERFDFHGPVFRLRICKGFTYRLGSINLDTKKVTYVETADFGDFYITNKRVVFVGKKNNFSYYFSQLIKSELIDAGLIFQKENTANASIVELSKYDLPLMILSRIFNA